VPCVHYVLVVSRVLHVAQPTEGGVAGVVVHLVADQVGAGWDVAVACPLIGPLAAAAADAGARVLSWPAVRGVGASAVAEALRLRSLVVRVDPDLVHLHSAKAGLAGRLALRGRRPTIFQPHAWSFDAVTGPMRWASLAWEWYASRWADRIACVSEHERRRGPWLAEDSAMTVVPNGVDLSRFRACDDADRDRARRALGLPAAPTVVCVGRLCRQKGQDLLLAAWPRIVEAVPRSQLVLVGDGPDRAALSAAAPPGVRFAGGVDDPRPWYAAADVVAMPSRWEGMALVQLEAMASARCLVATEVGGVGKPAVAGGAAAVPVGDIDALADALIVRLQRPEIAAVEAVAGRALVSREHDLARATERMRSAYLDMIASRTGSRLPRSRVGRVRVGAAR
jgi:glycosyltransferase involved in cell wall biosynthesis